MVKNSSATIDAPRVIASVRSPNSTARPPCSRAGACAPDGARRAWSATPASATAANEAAFSSSPASYQPAAASPPPISGPAVAPSPRAASTWPLAAATRASPAAAGTRANSAGELIATPAPSSTHRPSSTGSEPSESAIAATTTACPSDTRISRRRFSWRSTSRPATPPSATTGPQRHRNSAETASGEPVAPTCSASRIHSAASPTAETPVAQTSRRTSRRRSADMDGASAPPVSAA